MRIIKSKIFRIILVIVLFSIFLGKISYDMQNTAYADSVGIDCSVGSPRNIAQGTDFASADDLTLTGAGTCVLTTAATLTSLTIGTVGGDATILTHPANTDAQTYILDVTATGNITVYAGASINVDGKGYGGVESGEGYGPGGGGRVNYVSGAGGAHGGNGGAYTAGTGGIAYCSIDNVATIGSAGGSGNVGGGGGGGAGGGLIKLNVSGTLTINGTISADGSDAPGGYFAGGGAGGGVNFTAGTIAGTPQGFTSTGGSGNLSYGGEGGGGGGCVTINFTTANSLTADSFTINGGNSHPSAQHGGAGQVFMKQTGSNGDLIVKNSSSLGVGVYSPRLSGTPSTLDSLYIAAYAAYTSSSALTVAGDTTITTAATFDIEVGNNFIYTNAIAGDGTGTFKLYGTFTSAAGPVASVDNYALKVYSGGTFTNANDLTMTSDGELYVYAGGILADTTLGTLASGDILYLPASTLTSVTDLNITGGTASLYYGFNTGSVTNMTLSGGTTSLYEYTTANPFNLTTLTINTGATLTHAANTAAQTNILNVAATTITVDSGGSINVDGKGYGTGLANTTGYGPGAGIGTEDGYGGGGAHGGNGGASGGVGFGGTAYCSIDNVATMGSGGAGAWLNNGGAGGGLIKLNASGTLTINGTITADGSDGQAGYYAGGGAGGGVNFTAGTIAGTPQSFTATGGSNNVGGGGGGGGCVAAGYLTSSSLSALGISVTGGTSGSATAGSDGLISILNSVVPTTPSITGPTSNSYNNDPNLSIESSFYISDYTHLSSDWKISTDSGGSTIVWSASDDAVNLESIVVNSSNGTFTGALVGETALAANTQYYAFVRYTNAVGDSAWSAAAAFTTIYSGSSTSLSWEFNDSVPADAFTFNSANVAINSGANGLATLVDQGGGQYLGLFSLADYSRRKPVTISNAGSELTNYQVKLTVSYDADMQADFDDLRFTDAGGGTEIDYWIEEYTASTSATVWVEVPTLTAAGDTTIYMYYGNAGVSTTSNGSNTFMFFDDFSDGNYTSGPVWTKYVDAYGTCTNDTIEVVSGQLHISAAGDCTLFLMADSTNFDDYILEADITPLDSSTMTDMALLFRATAYNSNFYLAGFSNWSVPDEANLLKYSGGSWTVLDQDPFDYTASVVNAWKIIANGSALAFYIDDALKNSVTDATHTSGKIGIRVDSGFGSSPDEGYFDNFRVRQFVSSEPSMVFGAETQGGEYDDVKIVIAAGGTHPSYTKLLTFSETLGEGNVGFIKYQLSNNGTVWYFHSDTAWEAIVNDGDNNTAAEVNSYLPAFESEVGTGDLYLKIFLVSDGTEAVQLDTINLTYDGGAPTAPGSFTVSESTGTTATLTWTASVDDAFNHYEIWYGTNEIDVNSQSGTALEWDNNNDVNLLTASTTSTTITGLTPGLTYYAKIVALDDFGQSSSATTSFSSNMAPVVSGVTASELSDGSGNVSFSFVADDADNNDTLQALVEYNIGDGWVKATLAGIGATTGSPQLDNVADYQIGGAGGYILTSPGANTITGYWAALTDVAGADLSNAQFQVTLYDGVSVGNTLAADTFVLDVVSPTMFASFTGASTLPEQMTIEWAAVSDSNFNHYEIWYGETQSDVIARSGSASEWDNTDDATLTTQATATTTITGLSEDTGYFFKIWAIDDFGNETTIDDINVNTATIPVIVSAEVPEQSTDGSGYLFFQVTTADTDSASINGLVEIATDGVTFTKAYLAAPVSASHGTPPTIDNNETYPLRTIDATAQNTLTFYIDSKNSGFNNDETAIAAIRVSASDGTNAGSALTFTDITIDNEIPATVVDIAGGTYSAGQTVAISAYKNSTLATADTLASIYYTTDGTEPTSANYDGLAYGSVSLGISTTTTLRYFVVDSAGNAETPKHTDQYNIRSVPIITFESPVALLRTNAATIDVSGYVTDSNVIVSATVNGDTASLSGSDFSKSFLQGIPISGSDGAFAITVIAQNDLGDTGSSSINIILDTTPPSAPSVTSANTTNDDSFLIEGGKDANTSVYWGDTEIVALNSSTSWSYLADLNPGANSFIFTAKDDLGNESSTTDYEVVLDTTLPTLSIDSYSSSTTASSYDFTGTTDANTDVYVDDVLNTQSAASGAFTLSLALAVGANSFDVQAIDAAANGSTVETIAITRELDTVTLTAITLSPSTSRSIATGGTLEFTATGTYSDESVADVTDIVDWVSNNDLIGTFSQSGVFAALSSGVTTVFASFYDSITETLISSEEISITVAFVGGGGGGGSSSGGSSESGGSSDGNSTGEETSSDTSPAPSPTASSSPSAEPTVSPSPTPISSSTPEPSAEPAASPESLPAVSPSTEATPSASLPPQISPEPEASNTDSPAPTDSSEPTIEPAPDSGTISSGEPNSTASDRAESSITVPVGVTDENSSAVPSAPTPPTTRDNFVIILPETVTLAPLATEYLKNVPQNIAVVAARSTQLFGGEIVAAASTSSALYNDSDGDGISDVVEEINGSNPFDSASIPEDKNANNIGDVWEKVYDISPENGVHDSDADGCSDVIEANIGLNPTISDTDGDGLDDCAEINDYNTNPLVFTTLDEVLAQNPIYLNANSNTYYKAMNSVFTGRAPAGSRVILHILGENGRRFKIGETTATDDNKFLIIPESLPNGKYSILVETLVSQAEAAKFESTRKQLSQNQNSPALNSDKKRLDFNLNALSKTKIPFADLLKNSVTEAPYVSYESDPVEIQVSHDLDVEEPVARKFSSTILSEDHLIGNLKISADDNRPVIEGYFEQPDTFSKTKVIANWRSLLLTSALIADTSKGDFKIIAPDNLEAGQHTVYLYTVKEENGILKRSKDIILEFTVPETIKTFAFPIWIYLLIFIIAIISLTGYYYWRGRKIVLSVNRIGGVEK